MTSEHENEKTKKKTKSTGSWANNPILNFIEALLFYFAVQTTFIVSKKIGLSAARIALMPLITIAFLMLFIYFYTGQIKENHEFRWLTSFRKGDWKNWLIALGIFALVIAVQLGNNYLLKGTSTNQASIEKLGKLVYIIPYKIELGVVAPICEELIFRGLFFNAFFKKAEENKKIFWLGVITDGFVFSCFHGLQLTWFFAVYWILGCLLAWLYLYTRDLRCSTAVHLANNLIALI